MSDVPDHDHLVDTGKSRLTLEELGHVQPGMARIMPEIGMRIWKCYYAGKARNRPLARFQLEEAIELMEIGVLLRPKYTDNMYAFIDEQCTAVMEAIDSGDWDAFEARFHEMIEHANGYHDLYDKPFVRWKIPDQPPPDLDMTPRDQR